MRSYRVSTSTATATSSSIATSVMASGDSQPESATERHHQGSFAGLSTTVYTPESTHIPVAEQPFARLRLLAEVSSSQLDPFKQLATHPPIIFDGEDQEQSASSLSLSEEPSLSNEPSQAADDANPIMEVEEPHELRFTVLPDNNSKNTKIKTTLGVPKSKTAASIKERFPLAMLGTAPETVQAGITEGSKQLPSDQNMAIQDSDSTDKWIAYRGDKTKPFQCDYEACRKTFTTKRGLNRHSAIHTDASQFRCYSGDCFGKIKFRDSQALARHIQLTHTMEKPFECNICNKRYGLSYNLKRHKVQVHSTENEKNTKKEQKSPPKRERKVDPFEELATHRPITFDEEQEQSASSLSLPEEPSLFNEPSQAADDANPIMEVEKPHELRFTVMPDNNGENSKIIKIISIPRNQLKSSINDHFQRAFLGTVPEAVLTERVEEPELPSGQNAADQNTGSPDKWIMYGGDKTRLFKCVYEACSRTFTTRRGLSRHYVIHTAPSQFRCYWEACTGKIKYPDKQALARHIKTKHRMIRLFECNICNKRFGRSDNLMSHKRKIHSVRVESRKRKRK